MDAVLVALVLVTRLALPLEPLDDAFLLLAVVRNVLLGGGPHLLFGGDDAALSTLAWPVLVGLPAAMGFDLARSLAAVGLIAEVAAALLCRRLAERISGSRTAGALAAAALATQPVYLLASLGGMETPLVLALLALAGLAGVAGRPWTLAFAAGALAWARVEGLLVGGSLLALAAWSHLRTADRRKWRAPVAAGSLMLLAAPLAHRLVFGAWLPATVAAKAAAGEATWAAAGRVALEFLRAPLGTSSYWLVSPSVHVLLALAAVWGALRAARDPQLRRTLAWVGLPAAVHALLFVVAARAYATNFPWYFAPPLLAVAVLAAVGAAPGLVGLEARRVRPLLPAAVVLAIGLTAFPTLVSGIGRVRASFTAYRERGYAAAAVWLGRHAPGAAIASNEVGALAFFSPPGRPIVDLFGLARPAGEEGLPFLELVARRRPEVVVARADFVYRRAIDGRFPGAYSWARLGAVEIGLTPELAARLAPFQEELPRLYMTLDLEREPPGSRGAPP